MPPDSGRGKSGQQLACSAVPMIRVAAIMVPRRWYQGGRWYSRQLCGVKRGAAQRIEEALLTIFAAPDPPEIERRPDGARQRQENDAGVEGPKCILPMRMARWFAAISTSGSIVECCRTLLSVKLLLIIAFIATNA